MFLVMHKPKHPMRGRIAPDLYQDDCFQFCTSLAQFVVWIGRVCLGRGVHFGQHLINDLHNAALRTVWAFCHAIYIDDHWCLLMWCPPFFWALCSIRSEFLWLPLQMGTADADLAYLKKEALRCCSLGLLWLEAPSSACSACSACAVEHVFFLQQTQDEPLSTRQHMQ